ncbi:MAG: hypothetical protein GXZ02_09095 [Clostridiales bacterium]|nr:hypothetical protein [Clostridiales bacterium]
MELKEILDIIALIVKNADFTVVLDAFKQLLPVIERIISLFAMIFA